MIAIKEGMNADFVIWVFLLIRSKYTLPIDKSDLLDFYINANSQYIPATVNKSSRRFMAHRIIEKY